LSVARRVALSAARLPGAGAALRALSAERDLILMLHRVLPPREPSYDPELVVNTANFTALLEHLARRYDFIPLRDLAARARRSRPACVLTFDDGWHDNLEHAWPILARVGAPATIFLATGFIGTARRFWQERLWFCLRAGSVTAGVLCNAAEQAGLPAAEFTTADLTVVRRALLRHRSSVAERFVQAVESAAPGAVPPGPAFLDWQQAALLARGGIELGAHTVDHVVLTLEPANDVHRQIAGSHADVAAHLGAPPLTFAYPWGRWNDVARDAVRQCGFTAAVTTREALLPHADPFTLPRVFVSDSIVTAGKSFSAAAFDLHLARLRLRPQSTASGNY